MLLVAGLPFANPFKASRAALSLPVMLLGGMAAGILVALQWLVFQVRWLAVAAALIMSLATWVIARGTLGHLEVEIRQNLRTLRMGTTQMFQEID